MHLLPYDGRALPDLPYAPGWPHADTAAGLGFAADDGQGPAWTWLVIDDDGRIAGECGVKGPPGPDGVVEIGYGLAGPSRGHGLGGRAVTALVEQVAARPQVRRVDARVATGNVASRRVLERLGFTLVEVDRVELRYTRVV
jgi:RimJ/RimL family protein N-acetyltransferase